MDGKFIIIAAITIALVVISVKLFQTQMEIYQIKAELRKRVSFDHFAAFYKNQKENPS